LFAVMYELLSLARKEGMMGLERVIEEPAKAEVFKKRPLILNDHHVIEFIQDYLRLIISGDMDEHQLQARMDEEIETHHHDGEEPAQAMSKVSDAMPGFGIVAAVLGIVNTMGALGGPPSEIGHKVAAALVGTFLGILFAYGLLGPMSSALERMARDETHFYTTNKTLTMGFLRGYPPHDARPAATDLQGPGSAIAQEDLSRQRAMAKNSDQQAAPTIIVKRVKKGG